MTRLLDLGEILGKEELRGFPLISLLCSILLPHLAACVDQAYSSWSEEGTPAQSEAAYGVQEANQSRMQKTHSGSNCIFSLLWYLQKWFPQIFLLIKLPFPPWYPWENFLCSGSEEDVTRKCRRIRLGKQEDETIQGK